jgi:hypothetical protein
MISGQACQRGNNAECDKLLGCHRHAGHHHDVVVCCWRPPSAGLVGHLQQYPGPEDGS